MVDVLKNPLNLYPYSQQVLTQNMNNVTSWTTLKMAASGSFKPLVSMYHSSYIVVEWNLAVIVVLLLFVILFLILMHIPYPTYLLYEVSVIF